MTDFNEMVRKADEEYREAERSYRGGTSSIPGPMLLTLMFLTDDDAHAVVEQIKVNGGILAGDTTIGEGKIVHCSIADLRRWGQKDKVYRGDPTG